jgi:predicted enzyme related to lactoylglutathione lyase
VTNERQDPFDALRAPAPPVDPDPRFAAALRERVVRALLDPTSRDERPIDLARLDPGQLDAGPLDAGPRGETMTSDSATPTATVTNGDVVYASLWLSDVDRAAEFYGTLLGWQLMPGSAPNGRHIRDVRPAMGMWSVPPEQNTMYLCHGVDDVHEAIRRVRAAGGQAQEPVAEDFGLTAECVDNQGMRFALNEVPVGSPVAAGEPRTGELAYLTIGVPSTAAFREFYGAVFGWQFTPGRVNDGWGIDGVRPMSGLSGGAERPVVRPMYTVSDIAAAVEKVRELGGTAVEPATRPYGQESLCTDNQGTEFYLGQF